MKRSDRLDIPKLTKISLGTNSFKNTTSVDAKSRRLSEA